MQPIVTSDDLQTARGGRPRDPSRDVAIREAILKLLGDIGYGALTMDAVAAEAGVGKATIYRRWRAKEDLVVDTVSEMTRDLAAPPDTGSVEGDVRAVMHAFVQVVNGPVGAAMRSLLSAMHHQSALHQAFTEGPLEVWRSTFATVWDRAESRGELLPGMAGSIPAETVGALLVQRWLLTSLPVTDDYVDEVWSAVVQPLLRTFHP